MIQIRYQILRRLANIYNKTNCVVTQCAFQLLTRIIYQVTLLSRVVSKVKGYSKYKRKGIMKEIG